MKLTAITTNLMVRDMDRSLAFYRDLLGLQVEMTAPHGDGIGWARLVNGQAALMLQTVESLAEDLPHEAVKPVGGSFVFYCDVDDVDAAFHELDGKATLLFGMRDTEYGMREFGVTDPDGYSVTLAAQR